MTLFKADITPIVTYGISIIWDKLTTRDLTQIEKVKARFMNRALGEGKTAPSRLAYVLRRESFFIEVIRLPFLLTNTQAYDSALKELNAKRNDIWDEFYITDAMLTSEWKKPKYALRHIMTRYAINGFHHKICATTRLHEPSDGCV